jgi:hypothetical protein
MKDLVKKFMDRGISRRGFLSGLGGLGITALAAESMARSLAPFLPPAQDASAETSPSWLRKMRGTGGALLVAQLKAAGVEYIFFNPSSGAAVSRTTAANIGWSKPFPTKHPLYLGNYITETRYPGPTDLMVNFGSRLPYGENLKPTEKLVEIRREQDDAELRLVSKEA